MTADGKDNECGGSFGIGRSCIPYRGPAELWRRGCAHPQPSVFNPYCHSSTFSFRHSLRHEPEVVIRLANFTGAGNFGSARVIPANCTQDMHRCAWQQSIPRLLPSTTIFCCGSVTAMSVSAYRASPSLLATKLLIYIGHARRGIRLDC